MTARFSVRDARPEDGAALATIYNHYIRDTVITFEINEVTDLDMTARVQKSRKAGLPWLVAEDDAVVLGYAYAGSFRERAAYDHTLETSIYLDTNTRARGVGTALFAELFARLRHLAPGDSVHAPVHSLLGVIALPNDASVALHERFGMRHVGTTSQVGWKFDRWIDVGYWQLELD